MLSVVLSVDCLAGVTVEKLADSKAAVMVGLKEFSMAGMMDGWMAEMRVVKRVALLVCLKVDL